jgi:PIN domain nuclease of toxin-antitoxin system
VLKDIIYNIEYYQGDFAVSIEVLKELSNLLSAGNVKINIDYKNVVNVLMNLRIEICSFEEKHLKQLFGLPYFEAHRDPTDRNIIAHAIADNRILISGDGNFSLYKSAGLKFLEI